MNPMQWLYHLVPAGTPIPSMYEPGSLSAEGFVHASYRPAVAESAALYFGGRPVDVWRIDPRRLPAPVREAETPRGPMPHVHGPIPGEAVREVLPLSAMAG